MVSKIPIETNTSSDPKNSRIWFFSHLEESDFPNIFWLSTKDRNNGIYGFKKC